VKVIITVEAWKRLDKELDFLIEVKQMPSYKAHLLGKKLVKKAESLSQHPYKGQEESFLISLNQGHKRILEGDFKIIYLIVDEVVFVTDFFNTRRDPDTMNG